MKSACYRTPTTAWNLWKTDRYTHRSGHADKASRVLTLLAEAAQIANNSRGSETQHANRRKRVFYKSVWTSDTHFGERRSGASLPRSDAGCGGGLGFQADPRLKGIGVPDVSHTLKKVVNFGKKWYNTHQRTPFGTSVFTLIIPKGFSLYKKSSIFLSNSRYL